MKRRPGRRKKGWRVIDLRGLTSQERQISATVTLRRGHYRVVEIDEHSRVAVLEPEGEKAK